MHKPRPVVGVIGSGRVADPHSGEVGRLIARLGFDLLTGGGRGVMEAVGRAFCETSPRDGVAIGVIPGRVHGLERLEKRSATHVTYELHPGYPNEWVEIAIYTHLPDSGIEGTLRSSRNHINVLSSNAIVALPGREGTESEVFLAKEYGVPIVAYGHHLGPPPLGIHLAASIDDVEQFLVRSLRA